MLKQVETGYPRVLNDGEAEFVLWCDWLGGGVGWWAELNSLYQVPILQVVGAFEAGNDLNQSQWRNGAQNSSIFVARARPKAFTWTC